MTVRMSSSVKFILSTVPSLSYDIDLKSNREYLHPAVYTVMYPVVYPAVYPVVYPVFYPAVYPVRLVQLRQAGNVHVITHIVFVW